MALWEIYRQRNAVWIVILAAPMPTQARRVTHCMLWPNRLLLCCSFRWSDLSMPQKSMRVVGRECKRCVHASTFQMCISLGMNGNVNLVYVTIVLVDRSIRFRFRFRLGCVECGSAAGRKSICESTVLPHQLPITVDDLLRLWALT